MIRQNLTISRKEWQRIGQVTGWGGRPESLVDTYLAEVQDLVNRLQDLSKRFAQIGFETDEYYRENPDQLDIDLREANMFLDKSLEFADELKGDIDFAREGISQLKTKLFPGKGPSKLSDLPERVRGDYVQKSVV